MSFVLRFAPLFFPRLLFTFSTHASLPISPYIFREIALWMEQRASCATLLPLLQTLPAPLNQSVSHLSITSYPHNTNIHAPTRRRTGSPTPTLVKKDQIMYTNGPKLSLSLLFFSFVKFATICKQNSSRPCCHIPVVGSTEFFPLLPSLLFPPRHGILPPPFPQSANFLEPLTLNLPRSLMPNSCTA